MSWNFRVLAQQTEIGVQFEIHEVYYDDAGEIRSWSASSRPASGESPEEKPPLMHDLYR